MPLAVFRPISEAFLHKRTLRANGVGTTLVRPIIFKAGCRPLRLIRYKVVPQGLQRPSYRRTGVLS